MGVQSVGGARAPEPIDEGEASAATAAPSTNEGAAPVATRGSTSGRPVLQFAPPASDAAEVEAVEVAAPVAMLRSEEQVRALVARVVERSFPELAGVRIDVDFFESDAYFFQSRPHVGSLLNPFGADRFVIDVNRRAFDLDLPEHAAEAIIAHELAHTLCYVEHGLGGMLETLAGELSKRKRIDTERDTDLEAIARGYGPGLADYREWIYPKLTADDLAEKRAVYYTPEEIARIDEALRDDPSLYDRLRKHTPRDLAALERLLAP